MKAVLRSIKSDPHYYILLLVGLSGIVMSWVLNDTHVRELGDWIAVASGTWLIARGYYTR